MSIKFLIKNLKPLIAVTLLLTSCGNIDTQKKISTQLKGTNLPEVSIKKLSTNVSNLENKHVKKIKQNEINSSKEYSFEEYVNSLLKNNKSKEYPDINNIPD